MLVGREHEIKRLKERYESDSAELVAVYGRRRVGKTFLVDSVFENRFSFRHAGLSPTDDRYAADSERRHRMKEQIKHFYRSLLQAGMKKSRLPETWLDAFYALEDYLSAIDDGKSRLLIFLDEIQWLDTPRSGFITGLEAFWNGWACHRHNVMVIVCGSSTSWILDKLIHNHGGLYGRITCQINLRPFSLRECETFFASRGIVMSRYDVTQAYMMAGGIPYYLNYFQREYSLPQNIDALFFADQAPLKDEYDDLFASLFANPDTMKTIIGALAARNRGLTRQELLKCTGIANSGEFSRFLRALISGTFIIKYDSFGSSKRESLYKLTDPFCIFYLHFVKGQKESINWINLEDSRSVTAWRGFAFENVCWNHVKEIKQALGISGVSTKESLWSKRADADEEGAQIDLIIIRKDNVVHLCEMKFYSDEYAVNKEEHLKLNRRKKKLLEQIPKRASVHNTLITTYGLKNNEYAGDYVHTVTLDALFGDYGC